MQCRPLHADELGRAGDVAAEAVDLRQQILALENFARLAQWQRHQMLGAAIDRQRNVRADLLRQHVGGDGRIRLAAGEDQQALDVVAKLAHVARPIVSLQHRDGILADRAAERGPTSAPPVR